MNLHLVSCILFAYVAGCLAKLVPFTWAPAGFEKEVHGAKYQNQFSAGPPSRLRGTT